MSYNPDPGCGMATDKDVRVARVWTACSVLIMGAGTVASWFAEQWVFKVMTLVIPVLMMWMIHFAGAVTWRYHKQNPAMAYYGGEIQYTEPATEVIPVHSSSIIPGRMIVPENMQPYAGIPGLDDNAKPVVGGSEEV